MTRIEYKRLGMHWSVLESAQRAPNRRAEYFGLLDLIGAARRAGLCLTVAKLWEFYRHDYSNTH